MKTLSQYRGEARKNSLQMLSGTVLRRLRSPAKFAAFARNPIKSAKEILSPFYDENLREPSLEEKVSLYQNSMHRICSLGSSGSNVLTIQDFHGLSEIQPHVSDEQILTLKHHLDRQCSDKATTHDYHLIYQPIISRLSLGDIPKRFRLLEIGLGTNNLRFKSNMGLHGRPGASLRAFRDFLPNFDIFGADIDSDILFMEDRIHTSWVDQLSLPALDAMMNQESSYDLIIDDGLHNMEANLNTLSVALNHLSERGAVVIEDIEPREECRSTWLTVAKLLQDDYLCWVIETRGGGLMFAALKR